MGLGKTYSTKYLLDSNNSSGVAGQVLISTPSGIDWVDGSGSSVIGGPYLPLSAGSSYPLTGNLYINDSIPKLIFTDTDTSTAASISANSSNLTYTTVSTTRDHIFKGGTSTLMTIEGTGNVGIGIAPVSGARLTLGTGAVANEILSFAPASGGNAELRNTSSTGTFTFTNSDGGSEHMRIDSSGNVGIGTTSPGAKLEISHSGANNGLLLENTLNSSNYQIALNIRENEGLIFQRWIAGAFNGNLMRIGYTGAIKFDAYDSTNNTGTPTYLLGTDASGNVVKTNTVPGSGAGPYLPLAGGTMTGDLLMDGKAGVGNVIGLASGTSSDAMSLKLYTYNNIDPGGGLGTSTGNMIQADTGSNLVLRQTANDGDITFQSDDGSGGIATYFHLDGSVADGTNIGTRFPDQSIILLGSGSGWSDGAQIYHSGTNTHINNYVGHLDIRNYTDDGDIIFRSDDGTGGIATYLTLDGSSTDAYFSNPGNVGIGETSPTSKLSIKGAQAAIDITRGTTGDSKWEFSSDSTALYFSEMSTGTRAYMMTIKETTGNVGIGTTSPGQKLHVNGEAMFITDGTYGGYIGKGSALITTAAASDLAVRSEANMVFSTGGYVEKMRITSGGNVGIGDASPTSISANTSSLSVNSSRTDLSGGLISKANGTVKHQQYWDSTGYGFSLSANSGNFKFTGGNVGIGTTSPSRKLQVIGTDGAAKFYYNSSFTNAQYSVVDVGMMTSGTAADGFGPKITFRMGGNGYDGYAAGTIGTIRNGADNTHNLTFGTSNSGSMTTKMTITNSGNVGIGTTSPSYKLDVNGVIRGEQYLRLADTGGTNRFSIRAESTYGTIDNGSNTLNYNANNHLFLVGLSEKMRINSAGNVGIGTTSPGAKLDIFNTGGSAGSLADCQTYSALTIKPYSSVDSKLTFSANGISTQLIQATNNAGTNGRQISLQPFSGNVGIGVILPSEKLDVNGHIKAFNGYKGYVSDFNNGGFFHSPRSGDGANPLFIPINSTGMTSSDQYYNTWVPLYAGRVRKIILKHVSGSTPVATVCTFRKKINGVLSGTTYAGTVTNGGAVGMKVTFDFGTSNFTFNAEDEVQIGVVTGVATQPRMGGMSYQIWYEYNVT